MEGIFNKFKSCVKYYIIMKFNPCRERLDYLMNIAKEVVNNYYYNDNDNDISLKRFQEVYIPLVFMEIEKKKRV